MMFSRLFRRSAALAAAAAITLQALWPLLAQARPADPTLQVPLCSVDGVTHSVEIKIGKSTPLDERVASHGEHCKLCVFGDAKAALPGAVDPVVAPPEENLKVVRTQRSFNEQPQLLSAHPRAPPQAS